MFKHILKASVLTLLSCSMSVIASCPKADLPAKVDQLECMVQQYHNHPERCSGGVDKAECDLIRKRAFEANMIDETGRTFLEKGGYFPLPNMATGAVGSICKCGCFDASTNIYTYNFGMIPVSTLWQGDVVQQLTETATLSAVELTPVPVEWVLSGEEKADMYQFNLENDVVLKLTQHHGVLLASGQMVAAKDISAQDQLVAEDGQFIGIRSIDRVQPSDLVYNFEVQGDSKQEHIVSAEGILVGDVTWQNQYAQDLNAVLLRQ